MLVPKGAIINKSALAQGFDWNLKGNKPQPKPMLTKMSDVLRHKATMS